MGIARILAFTAVLLVYAGANLYIAARVFQCVNPHIAHINGVLFAAIYAFLASTPIMGYLPLPSGFGGAMRFVGSCWSGVFMYLLILFVAADIIVLLGRITNIIGWLPAGSARFYSGLTVISLTAAIICCGVYNANKIKHVSYEVQLGETSLGSMKIVLISDLHLGAANSENNLAKMVQGINDLNPDIVCIAGDIFNDDYNNIHNPDRASALFKSIEAPYGAYACLGNHDGGRTFGQMAGFLEESNIKLLNDECVIIDGRLALIGRLESRPIWGFGGLERKEIADVLAALALDQDIPVVVMDHDPANIGEYGGDVDLILAGHTHRGQLFPGNLMTKAMFAVDYGYRQMPENGPQVIVTSGASTWGPPMRIGTSNEIVSILLH